MEDVSIVRKMSHVEVLSLSVNNISTLADFACCKNLQELYIRKNNIHDLNEVLYLKDLPRLKNLWLADNPCAEGDNYRMTVLRHLPNLQKLDNQTVQSHEVERAQVQGAVLVLPTLSTAEEEAPFSGNHSSHHRPPPSGQPAAKPSPPQSTHQNGSEEVHPKYGNAARPRELEVATPSMDSNASNWPAPFQSPPMTSTPCGREVPPVRVAEAACSPVVASLPQEGHACQGMSPAEQHAFHARVQTLMDHSGRRMRKSAEINCDPVAIFEGDDPVSARQAGAQLGDARRFSSVEYLHTHSLESDALMSPPPEDGGSGRGSSAYGEVQHRASSHKPDKGSPTRLLPKGGKNRNANILSAVLCLIKELDYASLEVVDTAIHCRMEEVDG